MTAHRGRACLLRIPAVARSQKHRFHPGGLPVGPQSKSHECQTSRAYQCCQERILDPSVSCPKNAARPPAKRDHRGEAKQEETQGRPFPQDFGFGIKLWYSDVGLGSESGFA